MVGADWTPEDVKAAVAAAGLTFTVLARETRLSISAFSHALQRPVPAADAVIAACIGVHPAKIWPSRYAKSAGPEETGFDFSQIGSPLERAKAAAALRLARLQRAEPWRVISAYGQELGVRVEAVRKWRRNGVPHRWRLPLLRMAAERGVALSEKDFEAASLRQVSLRQGRHSTEGAEGERPKGARGAVRRSRGRKAGAA